MGDQNQETNQMNVAVDLLVLADKVAQGKVSREEAAKQIREAAGAIDTDTDQSATV